MGVGNMPKGEQQMLLRKLPAVDTVLRMPETEQLVCRFGNSTVVQQLREMIEEWREQILAGAITSSTLENQLKALPQHLEQRIARAQRPSLRPVINATGVIIHTNLGRSLLAEAAREQISRVASSYSTLEVDVATGERGSRYSHVVDLLVQLTGAEDAIVVNNNAGAVLLTLGALAQGREVIVSRGQLVEIGGSFRIPEVMEQSGCKLVEVGATNKTHLSDYERAIGHETAALLKVHTSNYRMIGFTEEVSSEKLVQLAHDRGLLALEDLGSGVLLNLENLGHIHEPTVQEALQVGMDIVTFSGDKLLGGPQAGVIVGKADYIRRISKHPLTRALRIDKLTLAAFEATLRLYLDQAAAVREIPTLRMLAERVDKLRSRASQLQTELVGRLGDLAEVCVVESVAQVGGGSLPGYDIPSAAVAIAPKAMSANELEAALRLGDTAVFTRIYRGRVLLDLRTVQPGEEGMVCSAVLAALEGAGA